MRTTNLYHRVSASLRKGLYRTLLNPWVVRIYDQINKPEGLGKRGERMAKRYLLQQGFVVLQQGYHDAHGEIDLIAVDERTIVFVEVKTRSSDSGGDPSEAVDDIKQKKIVNTAKGYLKWHHLADFPFRFDVVSVIWSRDSKRPAVRHFVSAFEPSDNFQMF